ncbi:MAG: HD domain-containing protein [Pseudomonadota bacterium]
MLFDSIMVSGPDILNSVSQKVLEEIRRTLIEQESAYQHKSTVKSFSSLWAHSSRVGRIAHRLARAESLEPEPALLAGLLHDAGKFAQGKYHKDDIPEEENAVRFVERILSGTEYERWIPTVNQAILPMYLAAEATSAIGRAVHDADSFEMLPQ